MNQSHEHAPSHDHNLKKSVLVAVTIFSVAYMINEPNIDSFDLAKALEYIHGEKMDSIPVHITGFVMSFMANIPMLAAIIQCMLNTKHKHSSKFQELVELIMIGGPFALIGIAACLDIIGEFVTLKESSILSQVFGYLGAAVSGLVSLYAAYKLHGFHAHDVMDEHGGGIKGFFKGFYATYFKNVWSTHEAYDAKYQKVFAVVDAGVKKFGNLFVHGFLGKFAADSFLQTTGLGGKISVIDGIMKTLLPLGVMVYEGNTEGHSLDKNSNKSYLLSSKISLAILGMIHTLPASTALAMMIGSFETGPFNGVLYNLLVFAGCSVVLGYPSVNGFMATTIEDFETATVAVTNKVKSWLGFSPSPSRQGYHEITSNNEETKLSAKLLAKFSCIICCKEKEQEKDELPFLHVGAEELNGYNV